MNNLPNDDAFYAKYNPEFNQCILPNLETLGCAVEDMCSWGGCMYETFGDELVRVLAMVELNPKRVWTILESEDTITIAAGFHYVNRMGYLITAEKWEHDQEQYVCDGGERDEWVHPEIQDGEVLLINVKDSEVWGCPEFCHSVRRGEVAYTTGGKEIVKEMKPLFGLLKKL